MSDVFPVLDMTEADAGPRARAAFLERLRAAVHDIGFFQLTGHQVTGAGKLLELTRQFFELPVEERDELSILKSPYFRGYSEVGRERTKGAPDQRGQLDIGPECEPYVPSPGDPEYLWLRGPNQWPKGLPQLRDAILDWTAQLTQVSHRLLRLILAALEAPEDFLDPVVSPDPHVHFKLLHYPGRDEKSEPSQGVGVHKDYGMLTLLLQDDKGGLQVAVEDGVFVDVPVVPGAFVVNLGELLEVATRGYLRATTHRVVSPAPGVDRYSAPFFYNPRLEASMPDLPTRFVTEADGVVHDPENPLTASYGDNVMRGMRRAFPEVMSLHHPDLVKASR
ncbi:isopenicillin N synthase family dioxygenase [Streptomyces iconiensis]|uniref:2-oxoglutarate and iron-dependent oxygenase domain-containing protein n=1 Tax=Streptomyces iconiensis TaxID=1384038 RepID=A0ABT7A0C1_9ACTN|nr:2-oxoglutarate and iron-dependent oxygenase domain-containing protein [Streptomyces iconiensis]MDJ1134782.1 2-oxoglutarate and iron-dependent oxygenase domain-containing protein [Streptomyces iconiensis]